MKLLLQIQLRPMNAFGIFERPTYSYCYI